MSQAPTPKTGIAHRWPSVGARGPMVLIAVAYVALALGYNLSVPPGESPDEPTHLGYVYYLLDHHRLPFLSEPGGEGITQGGHPPLYYAAAAVLAAPFGFARPVFLPNPHFTFNLEHPQAPNRLVHVGDGTFPYSGAPGVLAMHVVRLLSLVAGLMLLWATAGLARAIFPDRPYVVWVSAAVVAFLPGWDFFSGVFNNDTLASAWAGMGLLGAVLVAQGRTDRKHLLLVGTALGLGVMTKMTVSSTAAVAGLAVLVAAWRQRDWRVVPRAAVWLGLPVLVIAGWWIVRNMRLYGPSDPLAWKAFLEAGPSLLRRVPLRDEIGAFFQMQFATFWGSFGWTRNGFPSGVYQALAIATGCAVAGLALLVARGRRLAADSRWALALVTVAVALGYLSVFRLALVFDMSLSHGRYLYGLLAPLAVLFTAGLTALVPAKARPALAATVAVGMLALSLGALYGIVRPAFRNPQPLAAAEVAPRNVANADMAGRIRLLGYDVNGEPVAAGESISVTLYWQSLPANWDPSYPQPDGGNIVFVHALDASGEVVARLDGAPFGGRLPTMGWRPGDVYAQVVPLTVSPDAVTGEGTLLIGMYPTDRPNDRLPVSRGGVAEGDAYRAWPFVIRPARPVVVDAEAGNLRGDRLGEDRDWQLLGDRIDGRVAAGESVAVTLYWRTDTAPSREDGYTVFVQLGTPGEAAVATADSQPEEGRYPTNLWLPGEIVADRHVLRLPAELPPGDYSVKVGLYDMSEKRLPAFRADGSRWPDDAVDLGRP